jgi:4-methyl-5(b-hydroxyethyl)-thiazole monophosphate biosynthesis
MTYVFLADGVAEMEAVTVTEVLRRAGIDAKTVGVTGMTVTGARGMKLTADLPLDEAVTPSLTVLPGGLKGVENLAANITIQSLVQTTLQEDKPLGAICAAPRFLASMGLLKGRTVTCHPSVAEDVQNKGAYVLDRPWVREGNLVTGQGPGASLVFGLALVSLMLGEEKADALSKEMLTPWR